MSCISITLPGCQSQDSNVQIRWLMVPFQVPISKSKNGWQQRHLPSAAAAVAIAIADSSFPLPERVQFLCGLHRSGLHCSGINTLGVLGIKDGDADWKSREHHKMELFPP
nr:uncharacterized protein LOC113710368 [Coffea arabica]